MPDKLLLFLGSEKLYAYPWRAGVLGEGRAFASDAAGREAFARLLQQYRKARCYLLVDVVEEDFRFEAVPHVGGSEHRAMISRKLEQYYRSTPFRSAKIQYREAEGRRDDVTLFSALTNPATLTPWLEQMRAQQSLLAGIYSAPMLSAQLVAAPAKIGGIGGSSGGGKPAYPYVLLLTWQQNSGLRAIYFRNGHIVFSRLTRLADAEGLVEGIWSDLGRTYKYLESLSLLPLEMPLEIHIICDARDRERMAVGLENSERISYHFDAPAAVAARIGLDVKNAQAWQSSDATPLLLHLLGSRAPPSHYASAEHTRHFTLWKVRRALYLASGASLLFAAVWSASYLWQAATFKSDHTALENQRTALEAQYRNVAATFPKIPVAAGKMRQAVSAVNGLAAASPAPETFLPKIGAVLAKFPEVQMNKLSWSATKTPENVSAPLGGQAAPATGEPTNATNVAANATAGAEGAAAYYQVIFLDGAITPLAAPRNVPDGAPNSARLSTRISLRDTIATFDRLQQAFVEAGFKVTLLAAPVNLGANTVLSGDAGATQTAGGAFALKLVFSAAQKSAL